MQSDVPLDYAVFQLSPSRSRCELFVSCDGTSEKLASGLVKPFITHLKVAEEQVAFAGKSIKLDVDRDKNTETWFTKGTLERFVLFVSTPEVLEMVNTYDAEMSQLEAARKIYSQGAADHESGTSGGVGYGVTAAFDATKMELLRAIDVRLSAVKQALETACSCASAAGFNLKTVSELQFFAEHFGSHRLSDACSKFITLAQQRSDLFNPDNNTTLTWKASSDSVLHSSASSDMSLDDPSDDHAKPSTCIITNATLPSRHCSREPSPNPDLDERENMKDKDFDKDDAMRPATSATSESASTSAGKPQLPRRPSVQDRINLFENKAQNSPSTSDTISTSTDGKPELRRLISDVNSSTEKAVLRRWSGSSDMSIDVSGKRKEPDSNGNTPTPSGSSTHLIFSPKLKGPSDPKSQEGDKNSKAPLVTEFGSQSAVFHAGESCSETPAFSETNLKLPSFSGRSLEKDQSDACGIRSRTASSDRGDDFGFGTQSTSSYVQVKFSPGKIKKFGSPIQSEGDLGSVTSEVHLRPEIQSIGVELDPVPVKPRCQSLSKVEKSEGNDFESLASQMTRRGVGKESGGKMDLTVQSTFKTEEALSSASNDQIQRQSQPKGTLGVNDELKIKAKELEKLLAEHKLRVPGNQSSSACRIRDDVLAEEVGQPVNSKQKMNCKPTKDSSDINSFNTTPLSKTVDNHDYNVTPKHKIYSHGFSDEAKGKLYQKYMKKRDAKLTEDWSSSKPEKEAHMKAMYDSLEKSRAEMKVKLTGSTARRNSAYDTRRRAEKLKSYDTQFVMKRDQPTDAFMSVKDSSPKSTQGERVLPNKITLSPTSTTRNSTTPIHQSSGKTFKPGVGRRRTLYGNRLAQSVPNFSDLRKENTSPSSGGSKPAHVQERNHTRKKNIREELCLANEVKSKRAQSLKKNTPTTMEMNTSRYSDDVDDSQFMPSEYHREKHEDYGKLPDMESKSLSIKDNGISKASVVGKAARNEQCVGDASFGTEELTDVAKDEEHDYETIVVEESTYIENSKGRLSHESDKSGNSGYLNNNALRFVSQAEDFPISMPTLFHSMASTLDSPGESPGSWNLRSQNPFAYSREISDIDATVSSSGSPASWSLYTLSQAEAEANKMRKKWGAAQKPVIAIDSCYSYSRKDVTRGLRGSLQFGRKNQASESVADWISATTSVGDDSEDGRDLANCSSEDLRKSRMGFSRNHNSEEGFNGSDMFCEQGDLLFSLFIHELETLAFIVSTVKSDILICQSS
ncbi:hypothetical protein KSS87_022169 [Heliosperma pusillum]|nr:hypothetical protein KSS87_022169 [Heliosperma pusillum]